MKQFDEIIPDKLIYFFLVIKLIKNFVDYNAQELDQLKTDFVSLVSHELRGSLTTLNGGIEMVLKEKDVIPPEAKRIFEIMADEVKRLTNFVQTILDVSKLEAGKLN